MPFTTSRRLPTWTGWRVLACEIVPEVDDITKIRVLCAPFPDSKGAPVHFFHFLYSDRAPPYRFDALLKAMGIRDRVEDDRELEGRYFAARDFGRTAADFAPLDEAVARAA